MSAQVEDPIALSPWREMGQRSRSSAVAVAVVLIQTTTNRLQAANGQQCARGRANKTRGLSMANGPMDQWTNVDRTVGTYRLNRIPVE